MADLPEGFQIDQPDGGDSGTPRGNLPPGFVMDEHPSYNPAASALEGYLKGASANWRDEYYGASKASGLPDWLGGFRAPIGGARLLYENATQPKNLSSLVTGDTRGPVRKEYEHYRDEARAREAELQRQNPTAFGTGEIGGALTSALAIPGVGTPAALSRLGPVTGRIAGSALSGAGYGAVAGAGESEDSSDMLRNAAVGAGAGVAFGTVGAGLAEAAAPLVNPIVSRIGNTVRGWRDPEAEASRRIAQSIRSDRGAAGLPFTNEQITEMNAAGTPRAFMDAGERTRALARSAANTSPEARSALTEFTQQRFEQQSPRIADYIRNSVGGGHSVDDLEAIQDAARRINRPAYRMAYAAGEDGLWTPELERLAGSPAVRRAMENAVERGRDRAVADGFGAFNPGVTFENGIMQFGRGRGAPPYPNMQYWDYVQRELRDMQTAAQRAGHNEQGSAIRSLQRQLLGELDRANPAFQTARRGAAGFFGADNALEAGHNFAASAIASPADQLAARRATARMTPVERSLFARGYASRLADMVERSGDNRSVLNAAFFNNGAARQRTEMALGPQNARQLEALLRAERIVDRARTSIGGNSTTARQLIEAGLAGGATTGLIEQDFQPSHILSGAILGGIAKHGVQVVDQRVARRVGEMLTSNDPGILARGLQIAARQPNILNRLRQLTGVGAGVGTEAYETSGQRPKQGFKHGGVASRSRRKVQYRADGGEIDPDYQLQDDNSAPAGQPLRLTVHPRPIEHIPFPEAMPPPRASGTQQWESAIQEQKLREAQKPSMGQQVADIANNTAGIMGAPVFNQAKRMQDAFEHGINWGDPEQVKETSGGTLMDMMGIAGGNAAGRTEGLKTSLGMFFAAPKATAAEAEKMLASGASHGEIWNKLGIFQGADSLWRTEAFSPTPTKMLNPKTAETLGEAADFPHVFERHPELRETGFNWGTTSPEYGAEYIPHYEGGTPYNSMIAVNPRTPQRRLGDVAHEIQHAIQQRSGFSAAQEGDEYLRSANEVEARASALREKTYESLRREHGQQAADKWAKETPPWLAEDVPREQQLVGPRESMPKGGYAGPGGEPVEGLPQRVFASDAAQGAPIASRGTVGALGGTPGLSAADRQMLARGAQARGDRIANELSLPQLSSSPSSEALMNPAITSTRLQQSADTKAGREMLAAHDKAEPTVAAWREAFRAHGEDTPLWLQMDPAEAMKQAESLMTKDGGIWLPDWFKEMYRRPISRDSRSVNMYNPPVKEPRRFEADYPGVTGNGNPLSVDVEGRPLSAHHVVGRNMVGGADQPIRPSDFDALAQATTGASARDVPLSGGRAGRTLLNRVTGRPIGIDLLRSLSPEDRKMVYGHEISHAIDQTANEIPVKGLNKELKAVYNDLNNPDLATARKYNPDVNPASRKVVQGWTPEHNGYKGADIPREYMAEAIRAYMHDPNYLKTVAPTVAARIREYVNRHPELSKIIQFNSLVAGAGLTGAAGSEAPEQRARGGRIPGELPPSSKASHEEVGYVSVSPRKKQHCRECTKFIPAEQGGPACLKVSSPVVAGGWCRRFVRKSD